MALGSNTDATLSNPLPGIPLIESPLFNRFFGPQGPNADIWDTANFLNENGYVVLKNFMPGLDALCDEIISSLRSEFDFAGWQDNKRSGVNRGLRIQDTYNRHECVRKLAASEDVITLLSRLYGRQAFPFQTLNFPVGTEQHYHADTIHFSSYPEKFMCGVWVALEDIGADQGPLVYYPGSHKLPVYENVHYGINGFEKTGRSSQDHYHDAWHALVDALKLQPTYFHAKKGDMLIWCANLLHGGSPHLDIDKTRWSQVTHYYFDDCSYYTPMHSDPFVGRIALRTPINQIDNRAVPNKFLGELLSTEVVKKISPRKDLEEGLPADFDPQRYLAMYADLQKANVNPAQHYLKSGRREGRRYK